MARISLQFAPGAGWRFGTSLLVLHPSPFREVLGFSVFAVYGFPMTQAEEEHSDLQQRSHDDPPDSQVVRSI
jgi:hypothetical protein